MRSLWPIALLAAGCVQVAWQRESRYEPVPDGAIAGLRAEVTGLAECLATFGAPLWVWEHPEQGGLGAILAYGWYDELSWGLRFSVPVGERASASFDYDQLDGRMRGLVLFFDERWTLTRWRVGLLRDLTRDVRPPPAFVEEEA